VVGIGLTPMYNISNKFAVTADFTHNFTMKQHYGFDGILLNKDYTPKSGSYYNFSVGLIYYLGENKYHSDWY
jgi:OOP family OmpA-OmpF porin